MVEKGLEKEVVQIFEQIDLGRNFLLSGGAGSGKTFSLVQVIKEVFNRKPLARVACMTYTNSAVEEIERRVNQKNLSVTTIHDFLWDNIKSFQKDIKRTLLSLLRSRESKIKIILDDIPDNYFNNIEIQYKEWTKISEGIISHDEVILLAAAIFNENKLICDIIKDKFQFIFLDEYQDTHPSVIAIFLSHLNKSSKKNIIGFFGDSMQSIYEDGIGDLNVYVANGFVHEIKKIQNRRNPSSVINLANILRTDGIQQEPSEDHSAPNMVSGIVVEGKIKFVYSDTRSLNEIKEKVGWNFDDHKETKELNLTHNLIAPQAGFDKLIAIYDRDKVIDYRRKLQAYIKEHDVSIDYSVASFGDVIEILNIRPTQTQQTFIDENGELFEKAKKYNFQQLSKLYLDKESLIDDKKHNMNGENKKGSKRDKLIKHLFKIQHNVHLYETRAFNDFVRRTEFKIVNIESLKKLKTAMSNFVALIDKPIEDVIDFAHNQGICIKDDNFVSFVNDYEYLFDRVKKLDYSQFRNLYYYLEGFTPFSTQHKIKGEEYENVFVILDNGGWSNYNFEYLFNQDIYHALSTSKKTSFPSILNRSQKLFYVCCTRAKHNLVVYYQNPSDSVIAKAKQWFGDKNVHLI